MPRVSIIVPARNEAEHIEAALLSLLQLDYPDYEVIVVDDRSDDATGEIIDRLSSQWRARGEVSHHRLKVLHISELPAGMAGKGSLHVDRPRSKPPASGCCSPTLTWCSVPTRCAAP